MNQRRGSIAAEIDPAAKIAWLLVISIAGTWFLDPARLAIVTIAVILPFILIDKPEIAIAWKYKFLIMFVPSFLLIYHFGFKYVFLLEKFEISDVKWGASSYSLKILNSVLALTFLLATTDIRQLVNRLEKLGLPTKAAFAIYLTLRFIEILRVDASSIREALQLHSRTRWLQLTRYPATLVFLGLHRAGQTASAMDLRGFPGGSDRTYFGNRDWRLVGWLLPASSVIAAIFATYSF